MSFSLEMGKNGVIAWLTKLLKSRADGIIASIILLSLSTNVFCMAGQKGSRDNILTIKGLVDWSFWPNKQGLKIF